MDYKKKYDEALKCAEMYYKENKDYNVGFLPIIFPELAEIEDERIRKAIVGLIEELQRSDKHFAGVELTDMLAYLEKQKEHNFLNISTASEWLREHVGRYMNSEYNEFHKCVEYDGSIDKERLINDFEEAMQKEQKPWKVGANAYFTPEHKPAEWSEEDKENINSICSYLDSYCRYHEKDGYGVEECKIRKDWLKSLRPSWKPSEGQMEALKCAIEDVAKFSKRGGRQVELENEPYYSALHSLYCNLEKLM